MKEIRITIAVVLEMNVSDDTDLNVLEMEVSAQARRVHRVGVAGVDSLHRDRPGDQGATAESDGLPDDR